MRDRLIPDVLRREPQFRLLFAGQLLSILGDRVMLVALPFAVLETGGDASDVGLVIGAQLAPFIVFALIGGAISDRGDRRRVLIASDLVRLVVQAAGGALLISGEASPLSLGALAAVFGAADAFFQPAFTGLLPQTVSHPGQLQPANALRGLAFSGASVAGPALAGLLLAAWGAGTAMLFDAGTFALSVVFLLRLRPAVAAAEPPDDEAPRGLLGGIREGWSEVRSRPWVMAGLGAIATYSAIVLPAVYVLGPVSVSAEHGGAGAWAAVVVAFGVGSVLGDVILLRWRPPRAMATAAVALLLASCQAAVYGSGLGIAVMCALQLVTAVGVTAFWTLWEVSLQEHVPSGRLSRVSSFDYFAATALMPVGTALAGPVAEAAGVRETLFAMSGLGVVAGLLLLAVPGVRALPRGG